MVKSSIRSFLTRKPPKIESLQTKSFYKTPYSNFKSYVQNIGKPVWTKREYEKFSEEGYIKNVIANRCILMISKGAASIPFVLYKIKDDGSKTRIKSHQLLELLKRPNPISSGIDFLENIYSHKLIAGNAFVQGVGFDNDNYGNKISPTELHVLRPDRVTIIAGNNNLPLGYRYTIGKNKRDFMVNKITGKSDILHLKNFHPIDDWYGLSVIESAAYSIDQHNEANKWNQAMLQNGARPSGALILKSNDYEGNLCLTDEQFDKLKNQLNEEFSGALNAGKPLILEGGMEWKEMSLSPREMDFLNIKNSTARDIALAFGVPPQMLGIPGDNTYNNLAEGRLAMWEQTILPMVNNVINALNHWLTPMFGDDLELSYDDDQISALSLRRDVVWNKISNANFLTNEEKKEMLGINN